MLIEFACARCGRVMSRPVRQLDELPERVEDEFPGYAPTMTPGTWAIDPEPVGRNEDGSAMGSLGCPVLNPADLLELRPHPDRRRRNGCCRHDGLDGPNLVCPGCGEELATLQDDCWTYEEARLEPDRVVAVTLPNVGQAE